MTNREYIKSIERRLNKNNSEAGELFSERFRELESQLPLQTVEGLVTFNENIKNKDLRKMFVSI